MDKTKWEPEYVLLGIWVFLELVIDKSTLAETYSWIDYIQKGYKIIFFGIVIFCLWKRFKEQICNSQHKVLLYSGIGIVSATLLLVFYQTRSAGLYLAPSLALLLLVSGARIKKISLVYLGASITGSLTIFVLSQTGFTLNRVFYDDGVVLYAYGFGHPNMAAFELVNICATLLLLSLYVKRIRAVALVSIVASLLVNLVYLQSRTALTALIILLFIPLFWNKRHMASKFFFSITTGTLVISVVTSLYYALLAFRITVPFNIFLNQMLNGRLELMYRTIDTNGITLFGKIIEVNPIYNHQSTGVIPNGVDNGYIKFLLFFGVVISVLVLALVIFELWCASQQNSWVLFLLCMIFIVYLLIENMPTYLCFNFPLIILAVLTPPLLELDFRKKIL